MTVGLLFNEHKATQVAALLIKKAGESIDHLLLTKLLYIVDREALGRWGRPVSGGPYASLPHGPVISPALNLTRSSDQQSFWVQHITKDGNTIRLKADPGDGALSADEVEVIDLVFAKYGHWSPIDVRNLTHAEFREWKDPGASSLPIKVESILAALGKTREEIAAEIDDLEHLNQVRSMFGGQ